MSDIPLVNHPSKWRLRWVIMKNELVNIFRHPSYLILLIIPVFMSLAMGVMMGTLQDAEDLIVVVYDQGNSTWINELTELPDVEWQIVNSEAAVLEAVEDEATGGIIIPANFDTAVANGEQPELQAYVNHDASRGKTVTFRQGLINQVWAITYDAPPATINWQMANLDDGRFINFSLEVYIAVMFVIMAIVLTVINIAPQLLLEARSNGVFSMLMASPVELTDVLFGQSLATILCSIFISAILLLINFSAVINWPMTILMVLIFAIVLNGIGMILGLSTNTKQKCNVYMAVCGILLIIPVWFFVAPIDELPTVVVGLLQLTPSFHFGMILTHILNDTVTLEAVGFNLLALFSFGVLFYAIVHWLRQRPLPTLQN